jgi:hypothetical protein
MFWRSQLSEVRNVGIKIRDESQFAQLLCIFGRLFNKHAR